MKTIMKKVIVPIGIACIITGTMVGCAGNTTNKNQNNENTNQQVDAAEGKITYRFADAAEGIELRMANTDYFDNLTQNDLDYRTGKSGATLDEYKELVKKQGEDFTEEEKKVLGDTIARIQARFDEIGFDYPLKDEIVFVKNKMEDEFGATAYTHKNQIYLEGSNIEFMKDKVPLLDGVIAHELFHIISRNDPKLRQAIYSVFGFTITDEPDFTPELSDMFASNPDVEKFDSYATFNINGKPTKAVVVTLLKPYKDGQLLGDNMSPAIVPYDNPDTYYTIDQVSDFWDVFGENTPYVITTEEGIADNFTSAVIYGMDGRGYKNPEIIQSILDVLANYEETAE
ncbi:hypothetical protein [Clostridium butyricum]|uniref:hypothetical protein n=1 Tax=Clostridium butyricum TaxID=1492 RepID=UPI00210331F3|nr:hypothetical protein [Clostridium butyricum]MCQ2014887.1 hypothetical protein [Clostridium butyricum]MCQ2027747.1 hypothetical protein [Clostridium butyricum]